MLLGCLNGKLTAIHGGGGARVGASQAIFDLHVGLEVVGFWPFSFATQCVDIGARGGLPIDAPGGTQERARRQMVDTFLNFTLNM